MVSSFLQGVAAAAELSMTDCVACAGVTSENVAAKFGVDRATQDKMAARSHARAAAATNSGRFRDEIVPVHTVWKDPKTGGLPVRGPNSSHWSMHPRPAGLPPRQEVALLLWQPALLCEPQATRQCSQVLKGSDSTGEEKKIVVDKDDGIREGVTPGQLAKLPPVFKKNGSTTAGNSSQVESTPPSNKHRS